MKNIFSRKTEIKLSTKFDDLTYNQKKSLLNFLFLMARCDGEVSKQPNEQKILSSIHSDFKISLDDSLEYLDSDGIDRIFDDLTSISKIQKEFLLATSLDLILCDGKPNEIELNTLVSSFEKIGISEDDSFELIQKIILLSNGKFK